jgi:Tfp pilus assembly protein PilX
MKKTSLLTNENGSVIVLALIMLALLTMLGMAVSRTSSIEVQIASNDQQAVDCFYTAESADHYAIEISNVWMTDAFLIAAEDSANSDSLEDLDGDGNDDVRIEIRCVEGSGTPIVLPDGDLSAAANNLPVQQHITVPPVGSGYSLKYFEVRKYGITGTALGGCSPVQLGAFKVFNKF